MHNNFPATVMVLGVVSNEEYILPLHFFPQGRIEVLQNVVKPWIDCEYEDLIFFSKISPSHNAKLTQERMAENLYDQITPDIWPPNSPDPYPMEYYIYNVIEKEINEHSHNTINSLKATTMNVMLNMNQANLIKACKRFRSRVEAVVEDDGSFFE